MTYQAPVMFLGVLNSFIAEKILFDDDMPCGVRVTLAKSAVSTEIEFFLTDMVILRFSTHLVR